MIVPVAPESKCIGITAELRPSVIFFREGLRAGKDDFKDTIAQIRDFDAYRIYYKVPAAGVVNLLGIEDFIRLIGHGESGRFNILEEYRHILPGDVEIGIFLVKIIYDSTENINPLYNIPFFPFKGLPGFFKAGGLVSKGLILFLGNKRITNGIVNLF